MFSHKFNANKDPCDIICMVTQKSYFIQGSLLGGKCSQDVRHNPIKVFFIFHKAANGNEQCYTSFACVCKTVKKIISSTFLRDANYILHIKSSPLGERFP